MSEQSDIPVATPEDDVIEKQERHEFVIDQRLATAEAASDAENDAEFAKTGTAVIPATTAPGAAYVQAEAVAVRDALEAIRAALVASGVIAS